MLEHLKSFADVDSYKQHIFSSNAVFPNVSYVGETDKVYYNPHRDIQAGEIIYLNGGKLYATKLSNWNSSLATAQGVVVVPASHTADDTVINHPNAKKSHYNASPSYFNSPESESHK